MNEVTPQILSYLHKIKRKIRRDFFTEVMLWNAIILLVLVNIQNILHISLHYGLYISISCICYIISLPNLLKIDIQHTAKFIDRYYKLHNKISTAYFVISGNQTESIFQQCLLQDTYNEIQKLPKYVSAKNYSHFYIVAATLLILLQLTHPSSKKFLMPDGVVKVAKNKVKNLKSKLKQQSPEIQKFEKTLSRWSSQTTPQQMLEDINALEKSLQKKMQEQALIDTITKFLKIPNSIDSENLLEKLTQLTPNENQKLISQIQQNVVGNQNQKFVVDKIKNRDFVALKNFWDNLQKLKKTYKNTQRELRKLSQNIQQRFQIPGTLPSTNTSNIAQGSASSAVSDILKNQKWEQTQATNPDWYSDIEKPSWPKKYHNVVKKYFDLKRGDNEKQK